MRVKIFILGILLAILLAGMLGCGANQEYAETFPTLENLQIAELISEEWKNSPHQFAMPEVVERGIGCARCHDGYVFSEQKNLAGVDYVLAHPTGIDCQACHTGFGKELISTGLVNLPFSSEPFEAGAGAVCYACHNGNRDTRDLFAQSQQGTLQRLTTPHFGMAGTIVSGLGGMEYPGIEYPTTLAHSNLEQSCIQCHMPETENGYMKHSFNMDIAYIEQACGDCHEGAETFNINGFQDEIKSKLATLENAIKDATGAERINVGGGAFTFIGPDGEAIRDVSHEVYVATYNWRILMEEGSYGVHNPEYALALIQESYKALTGKEL